MNVYVGNRLPSTYQEVEYIQSSGTQYINTGLAGTAVNVIELSFLFPSLPPSDVVNVVGARENGTAISPVRVDTSNKMIPRFGSGVTTNTTLTSNKQYTVKTQYTSGSQTVYVNGTQVGTAGITWTRSNTYNIFLFGLNNNGSLGNSGTVRVFSFKMYSGTTLLRDFVPCYRKSDSVIGLYDLVNSAFYTNAGSGTFSKGSDVLTNAELKNAYIGDYNWMGVLPSTVCSYPFIENNTDLTGKTTLSSGGTKQTIGYKFSGTSDISYGSGGTATSIFASYRIKSNRAYGTDGNCLVGGTEKGRMGYNVSHSGGYQNAVQFSNGTWYKSNTLGTVNTRMYLAYGFNGTEAYVYKNGVKQVIATSTTYAEAVNKYFIDWNGSQYDVTVAYFLLDGIDRESEIIPFFNKTKSQFGL